VRNVLDQLGDPRAIVDAAGAPAQAAPGGLEIAAVVLLLVGGIVIPFVGWVVGCVLLWASPRWQRRDKLLGTLVWPGGLLAPAIVLLAAAAIGITAGQVCTTASSSATASTPGHPGHIGPVVTHCTGGLGIPPWLVITLTVAVLAAAAGGPVFTALRLLRRVREAPGSVAEEPELIPG
jgi:hypothetical protein